MTRRLALLPLLALLGCGVKAPPRPPLRASDAGVEEAGTTAGASADGGLTDGGEGADGGKAAPHAPQEAPGPR